MFGSPGKFPNAGMPLLFFLSKFLFYFKCFLLLTLLIFLIYLSALIQYNILWRVNNTDKKWKQAISRCTHIPCKNEKRQFLDAHTHTMQVMFNNGRCQVSVWSLADESIISIVRWDEFLLITHAWELAIITNFSITRCHYHCIHYYTVATYHSLLLDGILEDTLLTAPELP